MRKRGLENLTLTRHAGDNTNNEKLCVTPLTSLCKWISKYEQKGIVKVKSYLEQKCRKLWRVMID